MKAFIKRTVLKTLALVARNTQGKVVFYHDVYKTSSSCRTPTPLALMRQQIESASRQGWSPVVDVPTKDRTFQVQFDDGFRGVYECRDEMVGMGIRPTVNLSVAHIGSVGYLSTDEILELKRMGFRFQSHTWNHAWLPDCSDAELKHELVDSRAWLMDLLQDDVSQLCFPRGLFSQRVYEMSLAVGYQHLATCIPGAYDQGVMPHLLPRQLVQFASPRDFVAILNGGLGFLRRHYFNRQFVKEEA